MASLFQKTLTDVTDNTSIDGFYIDASMLTKPAKNTAWSVRKYTLKGGLQEGVEVVEINNGKLCFSVLPTRGMSVWKGRLGHLHLGWNSPIKEPVHPAFVSLYGKGAMGWLKGYNEWVVRCGLNSFGPPVKDVVIDADGRTKEEDLSLHGTIANTPARKLSIEIHDSEIVLIGEVDDVSFFGPALRLRAEYRTSFGAKTLTIHDTVTNLGSLPVEHQLLYHINYGEPLLEENARFCAPCKRISPRDSRAAEGMDHFDSYAAPLQGYREQVYFMTLAAKEENGQTLVMLKNANGEMASALRFDVSQLPFFTLWKNTAAKEDGYVTGLEPCTCFPNTRTYERTQGRVLTLKGGESRCTTVQLEALDDRESIQAVETEIETLQKTVQPERMPTWDPC